MQKTVVCESWERLDALVRNTEAPCLLSTDVRFLLCFNGTSKGTYRSACIRSDISSFSLYPDTEIAVGTVEMGVIGRLMLFVSTT